MTTRTENRWHIVKDVPITVLIMLASIFASGIIGFTVLQTEFKEYRLSNDARINELRNDLEQRTKDRIHGSTVNAMFQARDVEIRSLKDTVTEIRSKVSENNRLLHQIWREVPRKDKP